MFQALKVEQQLKQAMALLEEQHAATVTQEIDPEKKATKQHQHELLVELLRQEMSWEKCEPMAIEAYTKHLQRQDVDAMNRFLGSTDGKVYVEKYLPAVIKGTMASMQLAGERVDLIHAAMTNEEIPLPEPMSAPGATDDPQEVIARKIIKTFGREKFEKQMAELSTSVEKQMRMLGPLQNLDDKDDLDKFIAEMSAAFKKDAHFDAYMQPIANELAANLSEKELKGLFQAFSKPAWKSLTSKMEAADIELRGVIGKYMQEQVMPKIIALVMGKS
jgi:hypothetical protein